MSTIPSLSTATQTTPAATGAATTAPNVTHDTAAVEKDRDQSSNEALSPQALDATVSTLNQAFQPYGVEFEMDDDSGRMITRIMDSESGEQIRQIPSEELIRILHYVESQREEPQAGLLIDDVA